MIFKNRRYFTRQKFELKGSTLKIDIRNLFDAIEYEISYEQVDSKKKIQTIFNHGLLVVSLMILAFGLFFLVGSNDDMALLCVAIAGLFFILAFALRKRIIPINTYDGNKIELYFTERNKREVVGFADLIIKAANNHLPNKYGRIDPALPIEPQINSIQFLRDREIITEEEYEDKKNQLLGKNKSTIGYGYK